TSAPPVRAYDTSAAVLVEPWLDATADDARLLEQVATWYQRCLARHALAQQALQRRGLVHPELLSTFQLGFVDRRLGAQLPGPKRQEGRELRARLQALGILRESGHGHFNGSLTIPLCDAQGAIVDIYGRKVTRNLIRGTQLHTYLTDSQPHQGIFN